MERRSLVGRVADREGSLVRLCGSDATVKLDAEGKFTFQLCEKAFQKQFDAQRVAFGT